MRDRRALHPVDVRSGGDPDDLHGTQGLRCVPMPSGSHARRALGYSPGLRRRIQNAHQGDHHDPALGQVPLQPRTVHRHPRLGTGVLLPAFQ